MKQDAQLMTATQDSCSQISTVNHKILIRGQPFNHNNLISEKFHNLQKPDRVLSIVNSASKISVGLESVHRRIEKMKRNPSSGLNSESSFELKSGTNLFLSPSSRSLIVEDRVRGETC